MLVQTLIIEILTVARRYNCRLSFYLRYSPVVVKIHNFQSSPHILQSTLRNGAELHDAAVQKLPLLLGRLHFLVQLDGL